MTEWNPNAPEIIGLEWAPSSPLTVDQTLYTTSNVPPGASDSLLADGLGIAQRIRSLAAETIGSFELYVRAFVAGGLMIEVYEEGDETAGIPVTTVVRPNGDRNLTAVVNQAGAVVNLYQSVDEATLDLTDYITESGAVSFGAYAPLWNTAAWPAGRRILDVQLTYVVAATTSVAQQVTLRVRDGGTGDLTLATDYFSQSQGTVTYTKSLGPDNPFTGLPWSQANLVALSAAGGLNTMLVFEDQGGGAPNFRLYQMYLSVTYCDENRVAVAHASIPADGDFGLRSFTNVRVPDTGVANWAKANNTTYTYLVRRGLVPVTGTATYYPRPAGWTLHGWLDSGSVAPLQENDSAVSFMATLGAGFRPTNLNAELTKVRAILPRTTAPAYSESTQPFVARNRAYVAGDSTGTYASQQVTTTGARTFERLQFLCRPGESNGGANDLLVAVGTSPTPGAGVDTITDTITYDEVVGSVNVGTAADPWYLVDHIIPACAIAAATTRFIKWYTVAGLVEGEGYDLCPVYGAAGPGLSFGTYLGGSDAAYLNAVSVGYWDYFATLATLPAAPANVTATPEAVALPGSGESCSLDEYEGVRVEWDASADALVTQAEVQRYDDLTGSWDTIAYVEQDTPTLSYLDPDPAQNLTNSYRVRFLRATGEASDWSTEADASPLFAACGLIFVPWAAPADAVGYVWPTPTEWEFLDAETLVMFPIYGADGQVAFRPTETLGDSFEALVTVNAAETPTPREGRWVLDAIVDLAHDPTTPYVSVLDETGRRWYAALQVARGSRKEPEAYYAASVRVTTLQLVPTPVTT